MWSCMAVLVILRSILLVYVEIKAVELQAGVLHKDMTLMQNDSHGFKLT